MTDEVYIMNSYVFPVMTDYERQLPYYAKMVALDHPLRSTGKLSGMAESQAVLLRNGTATLIHQDQRLKLTSGQLVFIRAGEPYEWIVGDQAVADSIIIASRQDMTFWDNPESELPSGLYQLADAETIHEIFARIHETASNMALPDPAAISSGVFTLMVKLAQSAASSATASLQSRYLRLKPVLDYIVEHHAEAITLKTLSDLMKVTPQHLCTLFRKTMHARVFEYINLYRISISKQLLVDGTDRSIREIAGLVGFDDVSYYCFIFKRFEGLTPGEFRKNFVD